MFITDKPAVIPVNTIHKIIMHLQAEQGQEPCLPRVCTLNVGRQTDRQMDSQ